jgi:hypothetical protein
VTRLSGPQWSFVGCGPLGRGGVGDSCPSVCFCAKLADDGCYAWRPLCHCWILAACSAGGGSTDSNSPLSQTAAIAVGTSLGVLGLGVLVLLTVLVLKHTPLRLLRWRRSKTVDGFKCVATCSPPLLFRFHAGDRSCCYISMSLFAPLTYPCMLCCCCCCCRCTGAATCPLLTRPPVARLVLPVPHPDGTSVAPASLATTLPSWRRTTRRPPWCLAPRSPCRVEELVQVGHGWRVLFHCAVVVVRVAADAFIYPPVNKRYHELHERLGGGDERRRE